MGDHRPLDEFVSDGEAETGPDLEVFDDLWRIYRSVPNRSTCTGCGATADTFWESDGRLVCPECKIW